MGAKRAVSDTMPTVRLSARFSVLVAIVVAVSAAIWFVWNGLAIRESVVSRVLTEAQTLNAEMNAVWDYIDASQDTINRNSDGSYDFKGIYCSVAGRGIAKRFTKSSEGYAIRYVREDPRIGPDAPDSFEQLAMNEFRETGTTEYHGMAEYEGRPVFRYVSALAAKENCLECHGSPAGEFDKVGFLKEGMELGDLAGAVSIVIPLDTYEQEAAASFARSALLFAAMTVAIILVIRFALHRWVMDPLSQANDYLQSENEAKSSFLTIMSHELRTPLSSIIAATDFWEKTFKEKDPMERRLVREIKENGKSLLDMVNNTIDVARLEAGKFEMVQGEVDVTDIVNAALCSIDSLARREGIMVERRFDENVPVVVSDAGALHKIVMNLLSNALKFTGKNGTVRVEVGYLSGSELLRISVADTGVGIPQESFEEIFSRFHQVPDIKAKGKMGSGLGLFLVKNLAEKFGGSVEVQSVVGEGSVFTVWVPAVPVSAEGVDEDSEQVEGGCI